MTKCKQSCDVENHVCQNQVVCHSQAKNSGIKHKHKLSLELRPLEFHESSSESSSSSSLSESSSTSSSSGRVFLASTSPIICKYEDFNQSESNQSSLDYSRNRFYTCEKNQSVNDSTLSNGKSNIETDYDFNLEDGVAKELNLNNLNLHNHNAHILSIVHESSLFDKIEKDQNINENGNKKAKRLWKLLAKAVKHGLTATELEMRLDTSLVTQRNSLVCSPCLEIDRVDFERTTQTNQLTELSLYNGDIADSNYKNEAQIDISNGNCFYEQNNCENKNNPIEMYGQIVWKKLHKKDNDIMENLSFKNGKKETGIWLDCSFPGIHKLNDTQDSNLSLEICYLFRDMNFVDLVRTFDNTGYVGIWPSEEFLAVHMLNTCNTFKNKNICELGAGMTGLASLALAISVEAQSIVMTDGDERCLNNLNICLTANSDKFITKNITTRLLRWSHLNDYRDLLGKIDVILCSDCIFSDKSRMDLVHTMWKLLTPGGFSLVFAPQRGTTLNDFILASTDKGFQIAKCCDSQYIENISKHSTKTKDTKSHSPVMLTLTKPYSNDQK